VVVDVDVLFLEVEVVEVEVVDVEVVLVPEELWLTDTVSAA
jgi:hypothetical protein